MSSSSVSSSSSSNLVPPSLMMSINNSNSAASTIAAPIPIIRPTPSHASIPNAKSKRAARRDAHHATNTLNEHTPTSVLQQVKQKRKNKRATSNQRNSCDSHTDRSHTDRSNATTPKQQVEGHQAAVNTSNVSGASTLPHSMMKEFFSLVANWTSTNGNDTTAASTSTNPTVQVVASKAVSAPSSSASSMPPRTASYYALHQQDDHTSSFESGNETDREDDRMPIASPVPQRSPSLLYSDEDASHGSSHAVPCQYAQFGCEFKVQRSANGQHLDVHYQLAAQHHLECMQAKFTIVSSQKNQLQLSLDQAQLEIAEAKRRAENREQRYQKLRAAYERKRIALKRTRQLHTMRDLIGEFVSDESEITAALQIHGLADELTALRAELVEKNRLLVEAAEYIKSTASQQALPQQLQQQQQQQQQQPQPQQQVQQPQPVPMMQLQSHPHPMWQPSSPQLQPMIYRAPQFVTKPLLSAPMVRQASAPTSVRAPAKKEPTYIQVPHSALKPLQPLLNSQTLSNLLNFSSGSSSSSHSHSHPQSSSSRSQPQAYNAQQCVVEVPDSQPGSRGAQLGLDQFCPTVFLKKAGLYGDKPASKPKPPSQEGK